MFNSRKSAAGLRILHSSFKALMQLCAVSTLKRSNGNKDEHDPTWAHGGSGQRTHGDTMETGTREKGFQATFQGISDLRLFVTTTNTTITTSTLTSRWHPVSKTKAVEENHRHCEANTHILCTQTCSKNIRRLENERGKCYVTCEREEVVSKRWGAEDVKKRSRGRREITYGKKTYEDQYKWSYGRGKYKLER